MGICSYGFIESAKALYETEPTQEVSYRNIISRSYYGLYHCALAYADTLLTPPLSACAGPSHKKLSDFYKNYLDSKDKEKMIALKKIGINLLALHAERVKSDYKIDEPIYIQDAKSVLDRCEKIYLNIEDLAKKSSLQKTTTN